MKKNKKNYNNDNKEDKPRKNSSFVAFLKKRAPIYLGILALFMVFVIPTLTAKGLNDLLPTFEQEEEQNVVNFLMNYDGGDGTGLTVLKALEEKINDAYSGSNIFNDKNTNADLTIEKIVGGDSDQTYLVMLDFNAKNGEMNYSWNVNMLTGEIDSNNSESRHVVELVEFYD